MASNIPESWGFRGMEGLLRDLGPTEGQRQVYKKFKEAMKEIRQIGAREPPDRWRPPGADLAPEAVQRGTLDDKLRGLAASSLEAALALRQNKPINSPSNREKECHGKLLNLATEMGGLMKLQEQQVRIDEAYERLKYHYSSVTRKFEIWGTAVSTPDCTQTPHQDKNGRKYGIHNWQPDHLIKAYHTRTSCTKAIAFMEKNSPGNDLLLVPSTGGWQAAMGVIRAEQIIEEYPSMLEHPWRKAVALRLKMVTRTETWGRQDKEVTYVQMAPMFKPEFEHYDRKIGIRPQTYVEDKLELAPLPAEAKLELAHGYDTSYCGPYEGGRNKHPLEGSPAAKLFIAMFKIDLGQQQRLKIGMSLYRNRVRRFVQEAKNFYEKTYLSLIHI